MLTALLFPGQGSQYQGMGNALLRRSTHARNVFEEGSEALQLDLEQLCCDTTDEILRETQNAQPAILAVSTILFREWMETHGSENMIFAGHSLGELTALVCAGALPFAAGIRLARKRGEFMQKACENADGTMAAVLDADPEQVEAFCARFAPEELVVANYNAPDQIVLSGRKHTIDQVLRELGRASVRVVPLPVGGAFHSPLMKAAAAEFRVAASAVEFCPLQWKVVSNLTAAPYKNESEIVQMLYNQMINPVRWSETMQHLKLSGVGRMVELGPKNVLKNLALRNLSQMPAYSFEDDEINIKKEDLPEMEGKKINLLTRCLGIAVCTPNSNWDNAAYTKGVIEPYRSVEDTVEELEQDGRDAVNDEVQQALAMLHSVFKTKGTPKAEQAERYQQLIEEFNLSGDLRDLVEQYLNGLQYQG